MAPARNRRFLPGASRRGEIALVAALVVLTVGFSGSASGAAKGTEGVVVINTNLSYANASAAGTGMVISSSGEVLTNNHVIRGATTITVIEPRTQRRYTAR